MAHFIEKFISLSLWFFGVSAVLLLAFLVVEFLQHRRTYGSDAWSEEALLEERIQSGTLPAATHVIAEQNEPSLQPGRVVKAPPVRSVPLVHNVVR